MGCGASNPKYSSVNANEPISGKAGNSCLSDIDEGWKTVSKILSKARQNSPMNRVFPDRTGWKTIRIFVSSTFKDFDCEREILVKKVFPALQLWCQARHLHLIGVDLRWGIPKDYSNEDVVRTCFGEIDRCYAENVLPFFINLVGDRIGWIPQDDISASLKSRLSWIEGMSITEMEIVLAAYKSNNPNAMFMIRDPEFMGKVPSDIQWIFKEDKVPSDIAQYKLQKLKEFVQQNPHPNVPNVFVYSCHYDGMDIEKRLPRLVGLEETFGKIVYEFFRDRIDSQYPLDQKTFNRNYTEELKLQHTAFMKLVSSRVVGRDDFIKELIGKFDNINVPLLVYGPPGRGKTSLMASLANHAIQLAFVQTAKVFFHFVGAIPGSTSLLTMLQRITSELSNITDPAKLPKSLEDAIGTVRGLLSKSLANSSRWVIFIDAVNQFDEVSMASSQFAWIPDELSKNVKLVLSASAESRVFAQLREIASNWHLVELKPLDRISQENMVHSYLAQYSKKLDRDDIDALLQRRSAGNALWLSLAVNELRVFGQFRQLSKKIASFRDGLIELEDQVLERFEGETNGALLVATLCFLECSAKGLLETELLELLSSECLLPPELKSALRLEDSRVIAPNPDASRISAGQWAEIYSTLQLFIRPFGASGEGRLDFYHRSLSKAVRKRYLSVVGSGRNPDESSKITPVRLFFHRRLADYFESKCVDIDRCLEEYPSHAWYCGDSEKLTKFLTRWSVFDAMYDEEFSRLFSQNWALAFDLTRRQNAGSDDGQTNKLPTPLASPMEVPFTSLAARFMQRSYVSLVDKMIQRSQGKEVAMDHDVEVDTMDLADRLERVVKMLIQNGRYMAGSLLADRLVSLTTAEGQLKINLETSSLSDKLRHIGFLYLKAQVIYDSMRSQNKMNKRQLVRIFDLVRIFELVIAVFLKLSPRDVRLGRSLKSVAFFYASLAKHNAQSIIVTLNNARAKELAMERIEQAIDFYSVGKENADVVELADCYITRGVCECEPNQQQIGFFMRAHDLAVENVGIFHPIFDRVYFNIATYYEDTKAVDDAYINYRKWYDLLLTVYGAICPRTKRATNLLNKGVYKRAAAKFGHTVPPVSVKTVAGNYAEDDDETGDADDEQS